MSAPGPIEYRDATPAVRAVFDDIKRTRRVEDVNNFWKYLAHDPTSLKRTWESVKEIMTPGALDAVTKEMIYLAVSVTNGCGYCIASHGAAAGLRYKLVQQCQPLCRKLRIEEVDARQIAGRSAQASDQTELDRIIGDNE
jgi:AhpD family alkylhydroperoxidase